MIADLKTNKNDDTVNLVTKPSKLSKKKCCWLLMIRFNFLNNLIYNPYYWDVEKDGVFSVNFSANNIFKLWMNKDTILGINYNKRWKKSIKIKYFVVSKLPHHIILNLGIQNFHFLYTHLYYILFISHNSLFLFHTQTLSPHIILIPSSLYLIHP